MAYISVDDVKAIRTEIKKVFPAKNGWKFSITKEHSSTVHVNIMESKVDLDPENKGDYEVNHYYIDEIFKDNDVLRSIFNRIDKIINSVKQFEDRNAGDMGADYPDCNFYYSITVGKWDKKFVRIA